MKSWLNAIFVRENFWRMPEHDAAIQLNLAPSRQEVKHRKHNMPSTYFSTLCVDTSTQISKKRQTQAPLLILRLGTLPAVVFFNDTDPKLQLRMIVRLLLELLGLATPAVYCMAPDSKRNRWGLPDGRRQKLNRSCDAADAYPVEIRARSVKLKGLQHV